MEGITFIKLHVVFLNALYLQNFKMVSLAVLNVTFLDDIWLICSCNIKKG